MRVIAGELRGRKIATVRDLSVRPTTDRAKQVIFDVLTTRVDFEGVSVLDLFAGSGSLGIEAISRGAASVTFVERTNDVIEVLRRNLGSLGIEGACSIARDDAVRFISGTRDAFDIVFADPPYDLPEIERLPEIIAQSRVIKEHGWLIMEHRSTSNVEPDPATFSIIRKELGQTIALILQFRHGLLPPQEGTE